MHHNQKLAVGVSITLTLGAAFGVVAFLASHPSDGISHFDLQPVRACYGTASLCAALISANGPEQFRAMAALQAETPKAPARALFAGNALRGVPAAGAAATQKSPSVAARSQRVSMAPQMSVGLYYSTTTGNTETVAGYIAAATGLEGIDIGDADAAEIAGHDAIIVGAPTWHTGADTERSGTSWDEWLYNELPNIDLAGKKVAIFGVGDSAGYSDNFCDAAGELYDCFTARGAKVFGQSPSDEGFDYTESKSVVDGKFVGRVFDEDNYPDESEERATAWVGQLKSEGFM